MKRNFIILCFISMAFFLEIVFLSRLSFWGGSINFLLIILVALSLKLRPFSAILLGFFVGFGLDLFSGGSFIYFFSLALVSFLASISARIFLIKRGLFDFALIFFLSILSALIEILANFIFFERIYLFSLISLFFVAILNGGLAVLILPLFRKYYVS